MRSAESSASAGGSCSPPRKATCRSWPSGGLASPAICRRRRTITERAWNERRTQLASKLDPEADPRLAALLPGARNILVVPLLVDQGFRLGVVAVEHPSPRGQIKRWMVVLVEQFATHAALTLQNAWLLDELERKLEENRALQHQLLSKNLDLEVKVAERTKELTKSLRKIQSVDEQRRRLLARLVHAEEDERKRIAGDIHDDPMQKIVATNMRLQLMRRQLSDPEQLEVLDKLLSTVRSSIASLRHLIFELRPHALDQDGLGPALQEYLESLEADFEFRLEQRIRRNRPPSSGCSCIAWRKRRSRISASTPTPAALTSC